MTSAALSRILPFPGPEGVTSPSLEHVLRGFATDSDVFAWLSDHPIWFDTAGPDGRPVRVQRFVSRSSGLPFDVPVQKGLLSLAWALWRRDLIAYSEVREVWKLLTHVEGASVSAMPRDAAAAFLAIGAVPVSLLPIDTAIGAAARLCRGALQPWRPAASALWDRHLPSLEHFLAAGRRSLHDLIHPSSPASSRLGEVELWEDMDRARKLVEIEATVDDDLTRLSAAGVIKNGDFSESWSADCHVGELTQPERRVLKAALALEAFGCSDEQLRVELLNSLVSHRAARLWADRVVSRTSDVTVEALIAAGVIKPLGTVLAKVRERVRHYANPANGSVALAETLSVCLDEGHWFGIRDLKQSRAFATTPTSYSLSMGALAPATAIHFGGEGSLLTVAPPGAGKTRGYVLPNLLTYKGSVVVLDIKGECYAATAEARAQFSDVYLFAPEHPEQTGHRYNPLDGVSRDPMRLIEEARVVADAIVIPSQGEERFFDERARDLLTTLIAFVISQETQGEASATMADVHRLARSGGEELIACLRQMAGSSVAALRERASELGAMLGGFTDGADGAQKTLLNIFETLRQHLSVFEGERVRRITSGGSSWTPAALRQRPVSVYIRVSPPAIRSLAPLLRLVIATHLQSWMEDRSGMKAPEDTIPILLLLDEAPQLGAMPQIETAVQVGRSYGISTWLFAQHAEQIAAAYGARRARALMNSCSVQIWMNPIAEDAAGLSALLGERPGDDGRTRPMVHEYALTGPEFRDLAVVLAVGEKPLRVRKPHLVGNGYTEGVSTKQPSALIFRG